MPGQNFDPSTDSVLGVQGTARLSDKFDLTVQAVSRQAAGYDYTPHITWAYLHYRPTPPSPCGLAAPPPRSSCSPTP
jgi:hypothetical protein